MLGVSEMEQDQRTRTLEPVLGERWVLSVWQSAVATSVACSFLLYSYIPLNPTELWTHVDHGRSTLEQGRLSASDPQLPLAEGMPWINETWLAELVLGAVYEAGSAEGLSLLFAVLATSLGISWFIALYRLTGRSGAALTGWLLWTVVSFADLARFSPLLFGLLCMSILINLLISRPFWRTAENERSAWWIYPSIGALFVVWANSHISFWVGLLFLIALGLGQAYDCFHRTRSLKSVGNDHQVRQWIVVAEIAAISTIITPFGTALWRHALSSPFVRDPSQAWQPLVAASLGGVVFALTLLAIVIAARYSHRRIRGREVILITAFGALAALHRPFMIWYVSIVLFVLLPRFSRLIPPIDIARKKVDRPLQPMDFRYSLLTALAIWTVFTLSPAANPILGGTPRTDLQIYGKATPLAITDYLQSTADPDLIWAPLRWSGWLSMHADAKLFANHQLDRLPRLPQTDYWRIARADEGFSNTLDRYGIDALVIDRRDHQRLESRARDLKGWHVAFEDSQGLVVLRNKSSREDPHDQPS